MSTFGGFDKYEYRWLWTDGKKHSLNISNQGKKVDLQSLNKKTKDIITEKEEQCKNIYWLGIGMSGDHYLAVGFVLGWLVRTLKDTFEKSSGGKWKINHEEEEIDQEEARIMLADQLAELEKKIRNDPEFNLKRGSIVKGDVDGTELFDK